MKATYSDHLASKVESAEEKAKRIKDAQNTQVRVSTAKDSISQLTTELRLVERSAEELRFYVAVLEEVFDGTRPESVDGQISDAYRKAEIDEESLLDAAEESSFTEYTEQLRTAKEELNSAIETVRDHLQRDYISPELDELQSAKELNSIIGDDHGTFATHIQTTQEFLNKDLWDTESSVSTLAARWNRLQNQWQEHSDKQSWDNFQREHDLSDSTVRELQQFTSKDIVKLTDLSLNTLEEVKRVDELESALEVKLRA